MSTSKIQTTLSACLFSCLLLSFMPSSLLAQNAANKPQATETKVEETGTIKELEGEVLIHQGEKYVPATKDMRVRDGDRILSMSKSWAKIVYDNGCIGEATAISLYDVASDEGACLVWLNQQARHIASGGALRKNPGFLGSIASLTIISLQDNDNDKSRAISP